MLVDFQEAGGDIPVKEIMDLMQADPAFDVLFSLFGIGRFDSRGGTQCILGWGGAAPSLIP